MRRIDRRVLVFALVVLGCTLGRVSAGPPLTAPSPGGATERIDGAECVAGRVLVGIRSDPNRATADQIVAEVTKVLPGRVQKRLRSSNRGQVVIMDLPEGKTVAQAMKENWKQKDPRIEYVEPDYIRHTQALPNDPRFPEQWALHNTGQPGQQYAGNDISAVDAWDLQTGTPVVVAVIDTGVDYNHPDLQGRIWTNEVEAGGQSGVDDDGNGYVDDVYGYDFGQGTADPMDTIGHGTHVAGTIGAAGNDNYGVSGVAWNVKIMPLRIANALGALSDSTAVAAIDYAVANGAKVLSCSWGGTMPSTTLSQAIADAGDRDVLLVAAAGNGASTTPHYPAAYNLDNIISVASIDYTDALSYFSNWGATTVDLGAPGSGVDHYDTNNILSTFPPYVPLFSEDFQSVTPGIDCGGFTRVGSPCLWGTVSDNGHIFASADYQNNPYLPDADCSLETPAYDTTGLSHIRLQFNYRASLYAHGQLAVDVWDGTDWTNLGTITESTDSPLSDNWKGGEYCLDTYSNQDLKVRFRWTSDSYGGSGYVHIDNIRLSYWGSDYTYGFRSYRGTSMAAPHVSGAAALVWGRYPGLTCTAVKQRLLGTVDPLPALQGKCVSGGRLNVYRALQGVQNTTQNEWYTTIQAAINDANAGDEIVLQPGIYPENISFGGKQITVRGTNPDDPAVVDNTIIDGGRNGSVVTFDGTETSATVLSGVTLTNGYDFDGGGVYGRGTHATIAHCVIRDNETGATGGGISSVAGSISYCTISDNITAGTGGGLDGCHGNVSNCTITGNVAAWGGGADHYHGTMSNCVFAGNQATLGGGAVASSGTYINCLMIGNRATGDGGAVYGDWMVLQNCTIAGNTGTQGGGVWVPGNVTIVNCVIWGNSAASGPQMGAAGNGILTVSYSDVQAGQSGVYLAAGCTLNWGAGNIDADPVFRSPGGADGKAATWQDNDYHLDDGSPCIDAGDPAGNYTGQVDLDGQARVLNGRVDIGVDEHTVRVHAVPQAYATIQDAIDACFLPGDEVVVADGTYSGPGNRKLDPKGKKITIRSASGNPQNCILQCNGSGPGFYLHSGEDASTVIEGFTIINGSASDSGGGGIGCYNSSPTIRNCRIEQCTAQGYFYGGGIYLFNSSAQISDCVIERCNVTKGQSGAGIFTDGFGRPRITRCTLVENGCDPANLVYVGGGMCLLSGGGAVIDSCVIAGNKAGQGAGIFVGADGVRITNCTIISNESITMFAYGGGGLNCFIGNTILSNSILRGNSIQDGQTTTSNQIGLGPTIPGYAESALSVSYCNVEGGQVAVVVVPPDVLTWGSGNIDADPLFLDASNGDYRIPYNSPCVNAGDPNGVYAGSFDMEGQPRKMGPAVDIGADEFGGVLVSADPAGNTTLAKGANNILRLVFDKSLALPTGNPIVIQQLIASDPETLGTDLAGSFTYSLETTNVSNDTLKIVETGAVLTDVTWYRIQQSSTFDVQPFKFDLVTFVGDVFNDSAVNSLDLLQVNLAMGQVTDGREDVDGNGVVEQADVNMLSAHWGNVPPAKP